jgi:ElaB/YqjD/DUF883 family membrane-anchored ribosome-binding protein
MASTETRTGFRLPWVSDAHQSAETPTEEEQMEPAATSPEPNPGQEAVDQRPSPDLAVSVPADPTSDAPAPEPAAARPTRRPTKFLADLARAMHSAAEAERQQILDRFQGEAKAFIETIHERSAAEATELRSEADEDIAGIREWSKAEIARIREKTDERVADRKAELERASETHAARTEQQIERVNEAVGAFENEMSSFFDVLLAEEDPSRFTELASNLPEPPSLEAVAAAASASRFPRATTPSATTEPADGGWGAAAEPMAGASQPGWEATAAEPTAAEPTAWPEEPTPAVEDVTEAPTVEGSSPAEAASDETYAVDMAMESGSETQAEVPDATIAGTETGDEAATAEAPSDTDEAAVPAPAPTTAFEEDTYAVDPRVAALGLSPDFGAAEAEAAAAIGDELPDDGSGEEIATIDDETLASRLAGLVPTTPAGPSSQTQVIVSGLVSVASIAGFKRGLARLTGVQAVSVASGPDGEFVFIVTGSSDADLGSSVATLQGFAVQVTSVTADRIEVVAHDPDAA